ncbi:RNA-binding protein 7 [Stomoxys calcitrans]|uniref:RNA-binding protein 7 n=1 Tax=Stomoxys calcitrans TaxID=35570 RepID=UPI0027E29DF9|nr:RNA-binding protein 7 [Stomoxys calcitrans]
MNSPYDMQLQQLHQHFMMINNNANANMMLPGPMSSLQMPLTSKSRYQHVTEPIVVDESEDEDDEEQRTLFVANLDDRVTEELLYEAFLQAGPIERTRIPKDNAGRQRTFGFVTYNKRCSAPYAMHLLQGLSLYRKTLTIKFKGKNVLPPLKSPVLGAVGNPHKSYDNSALRSGNFSSYSDKRMMDNSSPTCSSRHQERISKHASSQMRQHSSSSPYQQRRDSPNLYDKWRNHSNHNNGNNNKNSNNRYSDNRSGKYRR